MFDPMNGLNPEEIRGQFARPLDQEAGQLNNYEAQVAELQEPIIRLGQQVSQWRADWQVGTLDRSSLELILPVLEALMLLPPQTRLELAGKDLEEFYQQVSHL